MDDKALNSWMQNELVYNAVTSRSQLLSSLMDPRRNINSECGYPETSSLSIDLYRQMYDREAVAARTVEVLPAETWKVQPSLYEDEDLDVETPFEIAWEELNKRLRGEHSWYQDEEGCLVWEMLARADVLSGIGSFGVVLLGTDDGKPLNMPLEPKPGRQLLFLRAFDESLIQIGSYDPDRTSPRYGLPTSYTLTFADPTEMHQGAGPAVSTEMVHWTRVIHLADNLGSSELFGVPRMRPVFNRLHDLQKLYSGSAEMYWRGAFPGLSIETHPQLGGDVEINTEAAREQMEQYMNGLQRYFAIQGITAKSLAPQVVDPTPQISTQIEAICIRLGIPMRIFMGSERGELASSQDSDTWDDRLRSRQANYVTPRIIVPFVDRLIWAGILPEPEGYSISWPDLAEASATEKATTAKMVTEAMSAYVGGGVDQLIEPQNYLTKILGFTDDEAEEITEATVDHVAEGGLPQPPLPEADQAMADLGVVEKEKQIGQIGKASPDAHLKLEAEKIKAKASVKAKAKAGK